MRLFSCSLRFNWPAALSISFVFFILIPWPQPSILPSEFVSKSSNSVVVSLPPLTSRRRDADPISDLPPTAITDKSEIFNFNLLPFRCTDIRFGAWVADRRCGSPHGQPTNLLLPKRNMSMTEQQFNTKGPPTKLIFREFFFKKKKREKKLD